MTRTTLCAILVLLAGCSTDDTPASPEPSAVGVANADPTLTVFSQNVYVGTNVDAVLSAPADQLQARLFEALATFASTNWPERADRIAEYIAANRPDLVSLNEVSHVTIQGLAPAFPDLDVDFLPILMSALANSGVNYVIAGSVANIDANLSLGGPSIRLEDFDVVLARADVAITNVIAQRYAAQVSVPLGALGTIDLVRGWVQVDATVGGRTVRFVSTHLEPQETSLPLQLVQSGELIASLAGSPYPVVIAGDLNSDPLDPAPLTSYDQFAAAGFYDAWLSRAGSRTESGYTCCTSSNLLDVPAGHHKRIDLVLARPVGRARGQAIRPVQFDVFGDAPADRTESGLWASDHAGVMATIPWRQLDGITRR